MEFERIADIKRLDFIIKVLKERLPLQAEVLDVGCGNGVISRGLGEVGFRVKGIDISEKTIEKAKLLNKFSNVQFEVCSAEQLVANNQRYHAIICSEVLEHLENPGRLLSVLHEVLHQDGVLIVTVPNGKVPRELFVTRPVIYMKKKNNFAWKIKKKMKSLRKQIPGSTSKMNRTTRNFVTGNNVIFWMRSETTMTLQIIWKMP